MSSRFFFIVVVAGAIALGALGYGIGIMIGGPGKTETAATDGPGYIADQAIFAEELDDQFAAITSLDENQIAAVRRIVRDHLISNPEIIREAIDALQNREREAELLAQTDVLSSDKERIFSSSRQVVLGNPDGDVTLVEFFDYNCGYCKRALADMARLIEDDENLRIVLKEFPVLGDSSVEAANVAIAVNLIAPEMYRDFHFALLSLPGRIDGSRAIAVAEEIGVDIAKLHETLPLPEVQATIAEVYDIATSLSLTGTPSYVTAKEVVVGAVGYDTLKASIEAARDCGPQGC